MLVLAIFHFLYVIYGCVLLLIHTCKTKKLDKAELIADCTDLCLSALLLLIGLAAEKIVAYNWPLFSIPLILHISGKLYLRKLSEKEKGTQ